jgi:hypothetical protein
LRLPRFTVRRTLTLVVSIAGLMAVCVAGASATTPVPVWPAGSELAAAANTANGTTYQPSTQLYSVACTSQGNCVAVGYFHDINGSYEAMISNEINGAWGVPTAAVLPSDAASASTGGQGATLYEVTCNGPGNCTAVGSYVDTSGADQAMVASETNGVWGAATKTTLPGGHDTSSSQYAELYDVTCTSVGNCIAGGYYKDTNGSNDYQAMLVQETGGAWQTAVKVQLPSDEGTGSNGQSAAFDTLACTSPGDCVAGGYYTDSADVQQAMTDTETGGAWAQATKLTLPAGYSTTDAGAYIDGMSCTSLGDCVGAGGYTDSGDVEHPMVATSTNGVWGTGSPLALPSDADTGANGHDAGLDDVTCASPGNCVATGVYTTTAGSGDDVPMTATETNGVWATPARLALPANAHADSATDHYDTLAGLSCTGPANCVAVGTYVDTSGNSQAMAVSSLPSLALLTSSLPGAVVGTPYSVQLSGSGGAGMYTWSLSAGLLPAGLALNASTGVISGTPLALDSAGFTAALSDPGPPLQTASTALSIAVGGPGLGKVKVKSPKVSVVIDCAATAGLTCSGTLKLTTKEHFTGHKLTAVSAKHKKKPKKTTKTVGLGQTSYSVAAGASVTRTVTLGQVANSLLKKHHKLPAVLTVTPTGVSTALLTKTVTLTPAAKKKPKKHH